MYLHLGKDTVINTGDIIAILDLESTTVSGHSREFLRIVEEEGFVRNVSAEEIPKSVVICEDRGRSLVYITNISTAALAKRVKRVQSKSQAYLFE